MILQEVVDLMDIACGAMGKQYSDLRVCELGDQRMRWNPCRSGKKYLVNKGVIEHISIDLNGKRGALVIDLNEPITQWKNYFDFVSNYGTTEHVTNQYMVFKNIHNIVKVGGAMIHTVPIAGGWEKHCQRHYEDWFFKDLANELKYRVVYNAVRIIKEKWENQKEIDRSLVCAILIKEKDNEFIDQESFNKNNGIKID